MARWFVVRNGEELGPYSAERLKQMAASGQLDPADKVRRENSQAPRTASTIKGLFTGAESKTPKAPATASPALAAEPPTGPPVTATSTARKKKLVVLSAVGGACLLLCCGGVGALFTIFSKEKQAAQQELAEADALWDSGDRAGAVTNYRALLQSRGRKAALRDGDKARAYGRVIDFDVEAGDAESAKRVVAEAASSKVTPSVNHPEAKLLVAQTAQTGGKGQEPADREGATGLLTAKYLPFVPGNVRRYEEERYDAVSGQVLTSTETQETYGKDNIIRVEGTVKFPGASPERISGQMHIRTSNGFVQIGQGFLDKVAHWTPLLKIGAKPGDEWLDAGKWKYRLVRFDKATAQGAKGPNEVVRAVIEMRSVGSEASVTEYVLERDGGLQSEKEYLVGDGQRKLTRHKRLVSSTYP